MSPEAQSMPNRRHDVARGGVVDVFHLVGVHAHEAADPDVAPGAAVDDRVALLQLPW